MEDFVAVYGEVLQAFAEKLDAYLEGNWYAFDYLVAGERTEIIHLTEKNQLIVYFGDSNTRNRACLSMLYVLNKRKLTIVDIHYLKGTNVYSKEIMALIGHQLKGKTKETLIQQNIHELQELYTSSIGRVRLLEEKIEVEKEHTKEIKEKIKHLKQALESS